MSNRDVCCAEERRNCESGPDYKDEVGRLKNNVKEMQDHINRLEFDLKSKEYKLEKTIADIQKTIEDLKPSPETTFALLFVASLLKQKD